MLAKGGGSYLSSIPILGHFLGPAQSQISQLNPESIADIHFDPKNGLFVVFVQNELRLIRQNDNEYYEQIMTFDIKATIFESVNSQLNS